MKKQLTKEHLAKIIAGAPVNSPAWEPQPLLLCENPRNGDLGVLYINVHNGMGHCFY